MNRNASKHGSIFARWPLWLGVIAVLLIVGASAAGLKDIFGGGDSSKKSESGKQGPLLIQANDPSYEVKQGPLTISISESGTIKASEVEIIKSEVEGQTTILFLIPEGTVAKKGDLLVELDSSQIQDQLVDQEIRVQNADASYVSSNENLEVVKNQAKSDVERADLDYNFAQQDLKKYKDGEYPKALNEAEAKIKLAEEELTRANEKAKWSKVLYTEKYLSQTELQADELAAKKKALDLELAKNDLQLLKNFTYTRQIAQLESDVSQTQMALERIKRKASANVVEAEANLKAKKAELDRQADKQKKLEEQIKKAKIYAPSEGLVVYSTSAGGSNRHFGGDDEPLQEGQSVRERQELIHLPKTASFIAQTKVHESSLEKIRMGLPARITVDALPGKTFMGRVSKIAPLPDAASVFMNPDLKVYSTEVALEGDVDDLRTGMSCRAEIVVAQYPNATYVPVQAATRIGKTPTIYVATGKEWKPRTVDLGLDNNRMVAVLKGIKAGEKVLLTPPLAASATDQPNEAEQEENQKMLAKANEAKPASAPVQPSGAQPQAVAADAGAPGAAPAPATGQPDLANMTPEQVQQMRQRYENMSPEEREQMRSRAAASASPEMRQKMMDAAKAAGVKIGEDGRPDFSSMTEEQRTALRAQLGSMGGGFGRGSGGPRGEGGAPGGEGRTREGGSDEGRRGRDEGGERQPPAEGGSSEGAPQGGGESSESSGQAGE